MEFFKPTTENKTGKLTFYIFECTAACLGFIFFIMAIVSGAQGRSFGLFLEGFINAVIVTLAFYWLGRVIDLLYVKKQESTKEKK